MKLIRNFSLFLILTLFLVQGVKAQSSRDSVKAVQLSGVVLTEENNEIIPLAFVNVYVKGTQRGTYSAADGFFSVVAAPGEKIVFSTIGYRTSEYIVPDTLNSSRYTIYQILSKDTFLLPETVIYPWPSREHFNLEFLAMDITDELEDNAAENLSEKAMAQLRAFLPTDGDENVDLYLKQVADEYTYAGQFKPIKVLNVFAWQQFIQAWKRGDFKKKSKK